MTGGLIIKAGIHKISHRDAAIPILATGFFVWVLFVGWCFFLRLLRESFWVKKKQLKNGIRCKGNKLVLETQV